MVVGPVERGRPGSVTACGKRLVSSSLEASASGEPSTRQKVRESSSRRLHWGQRFISADDGKNYSESQTCRSDPRTAALFIVTYSGNPILLRKPLNRGSLRRGMNGTSERNSTSDELRD